MIGDNSDMFRFSWLPVALYMFAATLLAGCGDLSATSSNGESGGGMIISGVGTGGTGVVKSALQAPVTDTGLIAAVVFRDRNGNRLHDQDEPFAITGQDGSCSLLPDPADGTEHPLLLQTVAGVTVVKATGQVVTGSTVIDLAQ